MSEERAPYEVAPRLPWRTAEEAVADALAAGWMPGDADPPGHEAEQARREVAALAVTVAGLEGTVDEVKATLFRFLDTLYAQNQRIEALERALGFTKLASHQDTEQSL